MRVVSLLPSATEILYALGVEPVGVSHECDYPPTAANLPTLTTTSVDGDASSTEINEQVADAADEGEVYDLDEDGLRAADPDLVVTQGICDVCAVGDRQVRRAVERLDLDAEVLTTHPHRLGDVLDDVERIGAAVGREGRAADLVADLRMRIDAVDAATEDLPTPDVAVLDWMDPVMVAGHWVPEMVELAGGRYPMADPGERSRPREFEELLAADPDALVVAPCGFTLDQIAANVDELAGRGGWTGLDAVRQGRTYAMDGDHHLNRPGPRLVDALEHLAGLLHPGEFEAPPGEVARPLVPEQRV